MNILIVEDNPQIMETLCDFLQMKQHQVECAYHGEAALHLLRQHSFDVIIMDIMMPKMDGIKAVKQLRQEQLSQAPVLFLTARDQLVDKIAAFEAGADDYLIKPFAMQELLLRLDALSKRGPRQDLAALQLGELHFDLAQNIVSRAGQVLKLSKTQRQILRLLMQNYPAMVSRQQLFELIWQGEEPDSDALRSHIYALRHVLDKTFSYSMLETVHGQGYRLVVN